MKKRVFLGILFFVITGLSLTSWALEPLGGTYMPAKGGSYRFYGLLGGYNPELEKQDIIETYGWGAKNVEEIKDLFPEEFYTMVKDPEGWGKIHINITAFKKWKGESFRRYEELTKKYKGMTSISPDCGLINYKGGCPFPEPKTGMEALFNFENRFSADDRRMSGAVKMIDGKRKARWNRSDNHKIRFFSRTMLDPKPLLLPNPHNIQFTQCVAMMAPYSIQGMFGFYHRYMDPVKGDDMWMYFPVFRRTRRMSTKQRQDSIGGGSNITWDNMECFSGKIYDYTWKLLGRKELLTVRNGKLKDPKWEKDGYFMGIDNYWQRANVWMVEGRPKDKNHMYSRFVLYLDPELWFATYTIHWDPKGRPLHMYYFMWGADADWFPEPIMPLIDLQRKYTSNCAFLGSEYNIGMKADYFDLDHLKKVFPVGR